MNSALREGGSTRAWRSLRVQWQLRLEEAGSMPCPRCKKPVYADKPWHLGHAVDRVSGGDDDHVRPEHPECNLSAGGRVGAAIRNSQR